MIWIPPVLFSFLDGLDTTSLFSFLDGLDTTSLLFFSQWSEYHQSIFRRGP
jgi:hypothetical protein